MANVLCKSVQLIDKKGVFGVVKRLLQRIRNQGWKNYQYENYILGGKEYNKKLGVLVSF